MNKFFTYSNLIKILISALFVAPLILLNDYIFPFIVPKVLFLRSLMLITTGAYIILLFSNFQKFKPKLSVLTISVLLFWLSFAISTFAGVDWYHSFWDNHERMLGLFTITHYIFVYLIASSVLNSEQDWTFVFRSILILGSAVMLVGMWQKFVNPEALLNRGSRRVSATLGNPIYYSGYGLFLLFLGLLQFYREWRGTHRMWAYASLIASVLGFIGIILGGTRGALLGLIVGMGILTLCYGFLSKTRNSLTRIARYGAVTGLIILTLLFIFRTTPVVSGIPLLGSLLNSTFSAGTVGTRVMAWKIAVESWKEKPIFGWGPNNYYYAFNAHYDPRFLDHGWAETWFDNAHSVIFNTLAVQGAFGIGIYLLIYVAAISLLYIGVKRSQVNQHVGFFSIAFLSAHLVSLVTVFENPTSYLYFFVFLGFVSFVVKQVTLKTSQIVLSEKNVPSSVQTSSDQKTSIGVSIAVWTFIVIFLYITDIGPARANKATVIAMQKVYAGVADKTLYDEPLSYSTPHIDDIRNDLSRVVFERIPQMAKDGKTLQVGGLFDRSVEELKKNQLLHPLDVRVHFTLSQYYNLGYQLTKNNNMRAQSEIELRHSLELSPKRQQFEYALAYNLVDQGKTKEAEDLLKSSIETNPKIGEGWWRLAVLYSYEVSSSTASTLIEDAIKMGVIFDANGKDVLKTIGIIVP